MTDSTTPVPADHAKACPALQGLPCTLCGATPYTEARVVETSAFNLRRTGWPQLPATPPPNGGPPAATVAAYGAAGPGVAPTPRPERRAHHTAAWAASEAGDRVLRHSEQAETPRQTVRSLRGVLAATQQTALDELRGAGKALQARDEEIAQLLEALAANDLDLKAARSNVQQLTEALEKQKAQATEQLRELARHKDGLVYQTDRSAQLQAQVHTAQFALDKVLDKLVAVAREAD